jgi:hypothetical protein
MDHDTFIELGDGRSGQVRGQETNNSGGRGRSEEKRCYAVSSKQPIE